MWLVSHQEPSAGKAFTVWSVFFFCAKLTSREVLFINYFSALSCFYIRSSALFSQQLNMKSAVICHTDVDGANLVHGCNHFSCIALHSVEQIMAFSYFILFRLSSKCRIPCTALTVYSSLYAFATGPSKVIIKLSLYQHIWAGNTQKCCSVPLL